MLVSLTLVHLKQETPDVASYLFRGEAAFTWRAGQFLQYTLPHLNPDERRPPATSQSPPPHSSTT